MTPILSVRDLHVNFGGVKSADGVELDIHAGEIVAIIGPNGSGKTTFINLCTGYVNPTRGSVIFDGEPITSLPPRKITRRGIARAFQIPQLFSGHSVLENVMLAVAAQSDIWQPIGPLDREVYREAARRILDLLALDDAADQPTAALPEGLRKLADIAIAIALRPRFLLLDEPTSGVSTAEKTPLMDTIVAMLRAEQITDEYRADVSLGVGIVKGRFTARVALTDLDPPRAATLSGGLDGSLGSTIGSGRVRLTPQGAATQIDYDYVVEISGKAAAVGGRMLDGATKVLIGQFFQRLFAEMAPEAAPRPGTARAWWRRLLQFLGLQS